jgi:hypothetical protein
VSRSPLLLAALVAAACVVAVSGSAATLPTRPLLGINGSSARFHGLTGQNSAVVHTIVGWNQGLTWGTPLPELLRGMRPVPLLGLNTTAKWPSRAEAITPAAIAAGKGDAFLLALNRAFAAAGGTAYLRPFGEMNGHWNLYSAFTASGRAKAQHSTASFRKAFARVYLIAHGGALASVNAALARLHLPAVQGASGDLASNPFPALRVIWNPQGYGSPDLRANSAQAYYPGDRFVDVVGDDLYDIRTKAEWKAADALYRAHPGKPFAFPEWGLWGIDDPAFIRRMHAFVLAHPRTELIAYFNSKPGSVFDLASKPRSLAAYRALIAPLG